MLTLINIFNKSCALNSQKKKWVNASKLKLCFYINAYHLHAYFHVIILMLCLNDLLGQVKGDPDYVM